MRLRLNQVAQSVRISKSGPVAPDKPLPQQARTEHQIAEPTIVTTLKVQKFIRTIPAGIEIRCRITGSSRAKKTPPAS